MLSQSVLPLSTAVQIPMGAISHIVRATSARRKLKQCVSDKTPEMHKMARVRRMRRENKINILRIICVGSMAQFETLSMPALIFV